MVESQLYPVTIESLYTIFTRVGKVLKIVTFSKNNCFQALIQFGDVASSIQAKHCMDGQPMFPGSNILRIEYSKLQNLVVKYNNDKSRDFTLTSSNGTSSMLSGMGYGGATTSSVNGNDNNAVHDFNSLLSSTTGALSFAPSAAQATSTPFASAASLNGPNAATFSPHYMGTTTLQAAFTNAALANTGMINPNAMLAAAAAATGMGVTGIVMSPVIHVSGLSEVSRMAFHQYLYQLSLFNYDLIYLFFFLSLLLLFLPFISYFSNYVFSFFPFSISILSLALFARKKNQNTLFCVPLTKHSPKYLSVLI